MPRVSPRWAPVLDLLNLDDQSKAKAEARRDWIKPLSRAADSVTRGCQAEPPWHAPSGPGFFGRWRRTLPAPYDAGVTLAFLAINCWLVFRHAMWRDEWAVWLVTRASSLGEVWAQTRCRGHPIGWYLSAWALDRLGAYPWGLKVLHILISTTTIYLLCARGPFSRVQKFLFAFGYFPLFEWGTIMRCYSAAYRTDYLWYWLEDRKFRLTPSTPAEVQEAIQTVMAEGVIWCWC